jgi:hypothetical protein
MAIVNPRAGHSSGVIAWGAGCDEKSIVGPERDAGLAGERSSKEEKVVGVS